jgi:hypothetical protein
MQHATSLTLFYTKVMRDGPLEVRPSSFLISFVNLLFSLVDQSDPYHESPPAVVTDTAEMVAIIVACCA